MVLQVNILKIHSDSLLCYYVGSSFITPTFEEHIIWWCVLGSGEVGWQSRDKPTIWVVRIMLLTQLQVLPVRPGRVFREEGEWEEVLERSCSQVELCVHTHWERGRRKELCKVRKPPLRNELHLVRSLYITMRHIYSLYYLMYACQKEKNGKEAQAGKLSQAKEQEVEICSHKENSPLKWVLLLKRDQIR